MSLHLALLLTGEKMVTQAKNGVEKKESDAMRSCLSLHRGQICTGMNSSPSKVDLKYDAHGKRLVFEWVRLSMRQTNAALGSHRNGANAGVRNERICTCHHSYPIVLIMVHRFTETFVKLFFFFGKPVIWQCTITAVYVFEFSNSETSCGDLSSGCIHNTTDRNSALSTRAYLEHPSPRALTRDQPRNPFCQEPRHLSKPVHEGRPLLEGE